MNMLSKEKNTNKRQFDTTPASTPCLESPAVWYVAYAQAQQEKVAAINLQQQGFDIYLPLYKTIKKRSAKTACISDASGPVITYEPMFPRYMFFKPGSPRQSLAPVRSTRGVHSIVSFGSSFAFVQPETLRAIQECEEQRNQVGLEVISPLQPGRRVRLRDPELNRLEGLVHSISAQRVVLLMEILGRQTLFKLKPGQIELI